MKEKIYVNYSNIYIPNYSLGNCKKLENILSYWDEKNYKRENIGFIYDDEKRILKIPRGVDINYICHVLNREPTYSKNPNPSDKMTVKLKTPPRDDDQRKSIAFLLGEKNFNYTRDYSQLLLELETGVGKTYCAIASSCHMKTKTAIIVDENKFLEQWKEKTLQYTNINNKEIYIVSGSDTINKILNDDKSHIRYKIYVMSIQTLDSFGKNYGYDRLNDFFSKIKVGLKIYDEAHRCFGKILRIDLNTNVKKTIYLTATAGRSNDKEDKVYNLAFGTIPRFGKELFKEKEKHTSTIIMKYKTNPSIQDRMNCTNKYGLDAKNFIDYQLSRRCNDPVIKYDKNVLDLKFISNLLMKFRLPRPESNMNSILLYLVRKYNFGDGKIAIIFPKNEHILEFKKFIESYMDIEIGLFSSLVSAKDKPFQLDKKLILSTEKSFGTGTDVRDLQVFINPIPYRSKILASQFQGRPRKNHKFETVYIELVDIAFDQVMSQYNDRKKVLYEKSKKFYELKV